MQAYPRMNVPAIADNLVHIGKLHLPQLVQQVPKLINHLPCCHLPTGSLLLREIAADFACLS